MFTPVIRLIVAIHSHIMVPDWVLRLGLIFPLPGEKYSAVLIDSEIEAHSIPKSTGELCAIIGGDTIISTSCSDHLFVIHLYDL
jgi:hypothetical protein